MSAEPPGDQPSRFTLLSRAEQSAAAGILALSLAAMAGYWFWHGGHRGGLVEFDEAQRAPIAFRIDLNTADWPELMQLPGIGETLARRIVEDRAANGPFRHGRDLERVRGIGPKTFADVEPYLLPLAPEEAVAGGP